MRDSGKRDFLRTMVVAEKLSMFLVVRTNRLRIFRFLRIFVIACEVDDREVHIPYSSQCFHQALGGVIKMWCGRVTMEYLIDLFQKESIHLGGVDDLADR